MSEENLVNLNQNLLETRPRRLLNSEERKERTKKLSRERNRRKSERRIYIGADGLTRWRNLRGGRTDSQFAKVLLDCYERSLNNEEKHSSRLQTLVVKKEECAPRANESSSIIDALNRETDSTTDTAPNSDVVPIRLKEEPLDECEDDCYTPLLADSEVVFRGEVQCIDKVEEIKIRLNISSSEYSDWEPQEDDESSVASDPEWIPRVRNEPSSGVKRSKRKRSHSDSIQPDIGAGDAPLPADADDNKVGEDEDTNPVQKPLSEPCSYCNKRVSVKLMDSHIARNHLEYPIKCTKCEKVLYSAKERRGHLKTHLKELCPICGIFGNPSNHRHRLGPRTMLECDLCGKKLDASRMTRHKRQVHENVRNHQCEQCGNRFKTYDALMVHYRIHTDDKPFACELCDYKGRQRHALNSHMFTQHKMNIPYMEAQKSEPRTVKSQQ